jgi:regulator of protease activity HflC (stomatin/prohibitin superfamily)
MVNTRSDRNEKKKEVKKVYEDWVVGLSLFFGAVVVLVVLYLGLFIVRQWERVALIRLGRIVKIEDKAGLHLRIPFIDRLYVVDMRMQTIQLKGQSTITKDNISVSIDAVVFAKVEDPEKVILARASGTKDTHCARLPKSRYCWND